MDSWPNYYDRPNPIAEECLYSHWLDCLEEQSPSEVIRCFRQLFIDGLDYPDIQVWLALERVVASSSAQQDFKFILNRSCHILINRWLMQPRLHGVIPELIALFELTPTGVARSRTSIRLRQLVQQFKETEQYLTLKRLATVTTHAHQELQGIEARPLGHLIQRYPCLYSHNLLTDDSTYEHRQKVRMLQNSMQKKLEVDLSRYITCRMRNGEPVIGRGSRELSRPHRGEVINPTLLSDRQLNMALQQFIGKVDGANTHRDLAQRFLTYSQRTRSYGTFKAELYEYLTASVDFKYAKGQFKQRLYHHLQGILAHSDDNPLNDALLLGTCRKLLNFLVIESPQQLNHSVFVDLTGNLGISFTIGLLLKVVLLCSNVKPYLEKRFAILFNHYERCASDAVNWLVEALEHLNIALTTNFGRMNFAY